MSIEKSLERIADALEKMAAQEPLEALTPAEEAPKPKRKRRTKKAEPEVTPEAPQPVSADEPEPTAKEPEAEKPVAEAQGFMTPEDLNRELMAVAQLGTPDVVNKILKILNDCGATNAAEVPAHRRAQVLEEAKKVVAGNAH